MDMRKKEDRDKYKAQISKWKDLDQTRTMRSYLLDLLDMADENEKLKEQIAFYKREQSNVLANN